MKYLIKLLLIVSTLLINNNAIARFATFQEAPINTLERNITIFVDEKAIVNYQFETLTEILNEDGRLNEGTTTLYTDSEGSTLEVIEAKK